MISARWRVAWGVMMLLVLGGCSESERTTLFDSTSSPRGDYQLNVYVIEPWFPQGPHQVAIELQVAKTGVRQPLVKTSLAYDGVPFTKKNIGSRWTGERTAFVCLSATDRPDKGIRITVAPTDEAQVEMRTGC